jgi:hypothetical protein
MHRPTILLVCLTALALPERSVAQPLGTFRWQLQPFCHVITVTVTHVGGVYRVEGTDDQCGAGRDLASVQGLAFPNPDGTIGFGLTTVTTPGGAAVHIDAAITLASLNGTWRDSTGEAGDFVFTPGAGVGGDFRAVPPTAIPHSVTFLTTGGVAPSGDGSRLLWHERKRAFRAGVALNGAWDEPNVGEGSAAFGRSTIASGRDATAWGEFSSATGQASTAMGSGTTASGTASTAMGRETRASGDYSLAAGYQSQAIGDHSVAIGDRAIANGDYSIALGHASTTPGARGSFVFGDDTVQAQQVAHSPNTFVVRATGGARFFTSAHTDIGPVLLAGGTDWLAVSDVNRKHRFRDLDGEDLLGRIARMPVTEWSYKAQPDGIRHIGPTAQDFHAAFGLGQDPLRISPLDSGGVALAAVRALEARTRDLREENASLRARLTALRSQVDRLLVEGRLR